MVICPSDLRCARSDKKKTEEGADDKKAAAISFAMFEDFSRRINADFSDILTIVEGYTQIALRKLREGRLTEEHLKHILKTLRRGTALTEDISGFFTDLPAAGDICDLAEAARLVMETLQVKENDGNADGMLHLSLPEQPCLIKGNFETLAHILVVFLPHVYGADGKLSDVSLSLGIRSLKDGRQQAVLDICHIGDDADTGEGLEAKLFYPRPSQLKRREDCLTRLYMAYVLVEQMDGCVCTAPVQVVRGCQRFQLLFPVVDPSS